VSFVAWVCLGGLVLAVYALTHWGPLVHRQRSWVWRSTKAASEVSEGLAGRPTRARRRLRVGLAGLIGKGTGTPLQIQPLASQAEGIDGAAVSAVLGSAISRGANLGSPMSPVVATPFVARPLLHEVADAISTVPQGRLLASVLQLLGRVLRRDELRLSGAVLHSGNRGPGLSLTLARRSGDLVDSLTIWADEYEPRHAPAASGDTDLADRLMQVSTAASAWTHFAILRFRLALCREDYRTMLGTPDWQSYAYLRTGARERSVPKPERRARALFALAVDADPRNLPAQFNLAFMETLEHDEVQAAGRLEAIHGRRGEIAIDRTATSLLSDRTTLDYDPFHFQVASIWASAAFNAYWRETRDRRNRKIEDRTEAATKLLDVWRVLTAELTMLQAALAILDPDEQVADVPVTSASEAKRLKSMDRCCRRRNKRWERGILSRSDSEQVALDGLLRRLEAPMLLRWAMMGMAIGDDLRDYEALVQIAPEGPPDLNRVILTRGLDRWRRYDEGTLTPHAVVERFLSKRARLDGNTRYELACYYAQTDNEVRSLEELEQSFAMGEHRAGWADDDPQLATLRDSDAYELLRERYPAS
jgi:hypothetical protein